MPTKTKITYLDGNVETLAVSLFDNMQAEKFARSSGWGNAQDSPIEIFAYATYFALRRSSKIQEGLSFEAWAETVSGIEEVQVDEAPLPGGLPGVSANLA